MTNFFGGNKNAEKQKLKFKLNVIKWLTKEGYHFDETSSGELKMEQCPLCGKTNKLYVDPHTGVCQCKSASCQLNNGGSPMDLVMAYTGCSKGEAFRLCYEVPDQKKQTNIFDLSDDEKKEDEDDFVYEKRKKEVPAIVMPKGFKDLQPSDSEAWNYLLGRGYSVEIIEKLKLKILPFSDYRIAWTALKNMKMTPDDIQTNLRYLNRIVFPLYYKGETYGFIARDFKGIVSSKYKVLNSEGSFRAEYFWNYDNVVGAKQVVICEGISDAVKCGVDRSIALLGTAAGDGQLEKIKELKPASIVLCLDVGTEDVQNHIFSKLFLSFPGKIFVVDLPPYLYTKKQLVSESVFDIIKKNYGLSEINGFTLNGFNFPHHLRKDLENKNSVNLFNLSEEDHKNLTEFLEEAQYKDAGDHSFEEMDSYIKNAKPFVKKAIDKSDKR